VAINLNTDPGVSVNFNGANMVRECNRPAGPALLGG